MIARHLLAFVVGVGLAACGSKTTKPANPGNTSTSTSPTKSASATDDDGLDATGRCCCALASDPETYQLEDPTYCHEDMHGVCTENITFCADSDTGGP